MASLKLANKASIYWDQAHNRLIQDQLTWCLAQDIEDHYVIECYEPRLHSTNVIHPLVAHTHWSPTEFLNHLVNPTTKTTNTTLLKQPLITPQTLQKWILLL